MTLCAETNGFAEYADSAHKLLSDNRDLYIAMSAMTVNGRVPTADEVRAKFPASLPRSQPAPAGLPNAGDYTNTAGAGPARQETDPFDQYVNTPIPIYRDGAEYERDAMQDGRYPAAD